MAIPDGYVEVLIDELAPLGFEFERTRTESEDEGGDESSDVIVFGADSLSFVQRHRGLGLDEVFSDEWPPHRLTLVIRLDRHGEPYVIEFEIFDVLAWSASAAPDLHDRLNTLNDPTDHAVALGVALSRLLQGPAEPADNYF